MTTWETVIGLEIHTQLNTKSKLFSSAPNRFGDEPNTNIGIVCTGQPGALPVLNCAAVHKAIRFGCAIQGKVSLYSRFDRKSYFYPDSPRNFQITQFDEPIVRGGFVVADVEGVEKEFAIQHAHIEDDAGMLKHFSSFAGVDYNRAGAALIEIVSEPCIRSAKEASAYAMAVRALLQYIDVSDCNMEEGSLRMDVNISVRLPSDVGLRKKIEVKNLNSFHHMELAIASEVLRQIAFYEANPGATLLSGTYRFDTETQKTILMREKESADDYRYFPEPDLPPLLLTEKEVEAVRAGLPELPHPRRLRYIQQLGLAPSSAAQLTQEKALADYFEAALQQCKDPRALCNWITVEFGGRFKEKGLSLLDSGIPPEHVGLLVALIEQGAITGKIAKSVADDMAQQPSSDPRHLVQNNPDYQPLNDQGSLEPLVDTVLAANAESVASWRAGKARAFDYLVGQVMKACRGKASPAVVHELLHKKLSSP